MEKFDQKIKDRGWFFHPNNHFVILFVAIAVIVVSIGVYLFCSSYRWDYDRAELKADVTATLVKITEGETEKWDYIEGKDEARTPQERATRTYKESVYTYYWEYEINGKTDYWETTDVSGTAHEIGDTMELRFWSNDGETWHRTYYGPVTEGFVYLSIILFVVALYFVIRVIIVKICVASRKKKKRKYNS